MSTHDDEASLARMRKKLHRRKRFYKTRGAGTVPAIHPTTRKLIQVDYQRDAKITDLNEDLRRLPGTLSWYLRLRDVAKDFVKEARHAEHNAEEDLSVELRDADDGLKETEIRTRIKAHPKMREAFRKRMDAESMLRGLESAVLAIQEKKWSLMSLTKLHIAEYGTDDNA